MPSVKDIKFGIPLFRENRRDEFHRWWPIMIVYSVQKDFNEAISINIDPDLPGQQLYFNTDGTVEKTPPTAWTADEKVAITRNMMAMSTFFVAFQKAPDCTGLANETKEREWPYGRAHKVVKELMGWFAPENIMGVMQQRKELNEIPMRTTEDPRTRRLLTSMKSLEEEQPHLQFRKRYWP